MFESSITIKGRTTLPKAVRDALAVKAGDRVRYVIVDEGVLILPVRPTSRLFSSLKYERPPREPERDGQCRRRGSDRKMETVDANVMLLYLEGDYPEQKAAACNLIDGPDGLGQPYGRDFE